MVVQDLVAIQAIKTSIVIGQNTYQIKKMIKAFSYNIVCQLDLFKLSSGSLKTND